MYNRESGLVMHTGRSNSQEAERHRSQWYKTGRETVITYFSLEEG
jgi:hypothetical protein